MAKKIIRAKLIEVEAGAGRDRFAAGTDHGTMSAEMIAANARGKLVLGDGVVLNGGKLYSIRTADGFTAWGVGEGTSGHSIQNAVWCLGISAKTGELLPFSKLQVIELMAGWGCETVRTDAVIEDVGPRFNVGGMFSNFQHRRFIERSGGKGNYRITSVRTTPEDERQTLPRFDGKSYGGLELALSDPDTLREVLGGKLTWGRKGRK